jgi:hypothetical protein
MPLQVTIDDNEVRYLNDLAKDELIKALTEHKEEVLREASRLEANNRPTPGTPEITSAVIKDAAFIIRRRYFAPRKNWWVIAAKIVVPFGGFSMAVSYSKITESWGPIALFASVLFTVIFTAISVLKD